MSLRILYNLFLPVFYFILLWFDASSFTSCDFFLVKHFEQQFLNERFYTNNVNYHYFQVILHWWKLYFPFLHTGPWRVVMLKETSVNCRKQETQDFKLRTRDAAVVNVTGYTCACADRWNDSTALSSTTIVTMNVQTSPLSIKWTWDSSKDLKPTFGLAASN